MMESSEGSEEKVLYVTFNQDSSSFCVGTDKGFRVYHSNPPKCYIKRDIDGGISFIDKLDQDNIFAFVGTGANRKYDQNKIIFWDDNHSKVIRDMIIMYNIKNIKLKNTKMFLIYENDIFTLENYKKIDSISTCNNKNGIFGISLDPKINIITYPSTETGKIVIKNYDEKEDGDYVKKEIKAHENEIVALIINYDGSLVASASGKGTLIKIFSVKDFCLIHQLRRGTEPAEIYSLCFDFKSLYIACSSNKGTIHIFNVKNDENQNEAQNQKSVIGSFVSFFGIQNDYLNSEWSFAQYRLACKERSLVSFFPDKVPTIIVLSYDGMYHKGSFNPKVGGECVFTLEKNYLDLEIEGD